MRVLSLFCAILREFAFSYICPYLGRIPADELGSQLGDAGADAGRVARQVVRSQRHNLAVADNRILYEQPYTTSALVVTPIIKKGAQVA